MKIIEVDAQKQARTPRDVKGPWVRPRVPSKVNGRKGTRKGWKRKNAPHHILFYREPDDVLVMNGETIIATPRQYLAIKESPDVSRSPILAGPFGSGGGFPSYNPFNVR